jgi:hypothetical protein
MSDGSVHGLVHKDNHEEYSARREVQASALGRAMGAPILTVVEDPDNPEAVYLDLYDGATPDELGAEEAIENGEDWYDGDGRGDGIMQEWVGQDEGLLLGLFDAVWGNTDRHSSNILISNTQTGMVGIDHTHSSIGYGSGWSDPSLFAMQFVDYDVRSGRNAPIDNPMHSDDMELIAQRVAPLRSMFTDPEWEDIQKRLALLTAYASGTRRRLS